MQVNDVVMKEMQCAEYINFDVCMAIYLRLLPSAVLAFYYTWHAAHLFATLFSWKIGCVSFPRVRLMHGNIWIKSSCRHGFNALYRIVYVYMKKSSRQIQRMKKYRKNYNLFGFDDFSVVLSLAAVPSHRRGKMGSRLNNCETKRLPLMP